MEEKMICEQKPKTLEEMNKRELKRVAKRIFEKKENWQRKIGELEFFYVKTKKEYLDNIQSCDDEIEQIKEFLQK